MLMNMEYLIMDMWYPMMDMEFPMHQYKYLDLLTPIQPDLLSVFTSTRFLIKSPRGTRYPPPTQACQYLVVPGPGVCGLSLTFSWFSLNTSHNCTSEYLDISGHRLCGNLTGKTGVLLI